MNNTRKLVYTALLAALTAAGAFMRIPMGYSSVTLQYLFTAMAGLLLGRKWGALSQLIYVCLGLVGLPIFTMGGGFGYVFQPTFGFLLGLIPAAWVVGAAAGESLDPRRMALASLAGLAVLYALYGADPQRLHGKGHDAVRAAVGGDAALSARRRGEDHRGGGRVPGAAAAAEAGRWQP